MKEVRTAKYDKARTRWWSSSEPPRITNAIPAGPQKTFEKGIGPSEMRDLAYAVTCQAPQDVDAFADWVRYPAVGGVSRYEPLWVKLVPSSTFSNALGRGFRCGTCTGPDGRSCAADRSAGFCY